MMIVGRSDMVKKIALCGFPNTNKTDMVRYISYMTDNKGCIYAKNPWENQIHLNFSINKSSYYINAMSGPFVESRDDLYESILYEAGMVIYVICYPHITNSCYRKKLTTPEIIRKDSYYKKWISISSSMKKSYKDIPWLCIVHEPRLTLSREYIEDMPQELGANIIYKNITEPSDVRDVLIHMMKMIG